MINITFPKLPSGVRTMVRVVESAHLGLKTSKGILEPSSMGHSHGAMVTAVLDQGIGFSATADLSPGGLQNAADQAYLLAKLTAHTELYTGMRQDDILASPKEKFQWSTAIKRVNRDRRPWMELLRDEANSIKKTSDLVFWEVGLTEDISEHFIWIDGELISDQKFMHLMPYSNATVCVAGVTQTRHLGGYSSQWCRQGGDDAFENIAFQGSLKRAFDEAMALACAPPCPSLRGALILMPDQMLMQIHESIGHPLELDRILGDERNYAGTSFVTLDMFGSYQYGSQHLTVRFDPGTSDLTRNEFASYACDDMGSQAENRILIDRGTLIRPLGGRLSAKRAEKQGYPLDFVANARASGWDRPPIDRMANINIDPGTASLNELVSSVDHGVLMTTNTSWSIDDSRNKFQFGCELGYEIRAGQIAGLVRNPGYRGVSASFWKSLSMVGDSSTFEVMGTPNCGKGEPNQGARVGHASPACRFDNVEIFSTAS